MNDDELLTLVREQRNKIPMTVPLEQIITRGRAVRARRRIPGLAAALAVVAAAMVAGSALLPSSHPAGPQPGIQLAAWTVVKHADGTVSVTIRELRDPAGLQRTLRAEGVPASVIFGTQPNVPAQLVPVIRRSEAATEGRHAFGCAWTASRTRDRHGNPPLGPAQRGRRADHHQPSQRRHPSGNR